jgi:hypothetical protein
MISLCARETSLGHVMLWVLITALIGVVFHGILGKRQNTQPSFTQGIPAPDCTPGTCSSVNFTVPKSSDWTQGRVDGIRMDKKGLDPGTVRRLKLVTFTHESSSHQVFLSFYEEMRSEFSISIKARNLFLSLAESIAQPRDVTLCYVCGGTNPGDHWPWEAKELNLWEPFNEGFLSHRKSTWLLKTSSMEIIVFPTKRSVLHPGEGFNLLRTKVLQ